MPDRYQYHRRGSLAAGLIAITIGVVFLFYEAGAFPADFRLDFWAVIFVAGGLAQMIGTKEGKDRIWGLALIAVGVISQTNVMGYTHLHMRQMWPLIFIVIGISTLWHGMSESPTRAYKLGVMQRIKEGMMPEDGMPENPEINMDFVLGGGEPRIESKNFRGGRVNAMLGGFKLDLTRADIAGEEAVLYVNTILGGGEIFVPESWLVEMHGSAVLGGYDNKTRHFQPDATKPVKRLIIRGNAILGGIEVKNH